MASESPPAPRFDLRVPILYQAHGARGSGMIWDISTSGARIEVATTDVAPGSLIRVRFVYSPTEPPLLTSAQVVRCTEGGFAVEFVNMERHAHHLLADALSKAGVLRH